MASEIEVRRRAEEAYRSTEDRLAGILDIAEDAIIVADSSRTITLFNQGAVKLFGYTSVEILGQSLDRLLPERFRNTHSQHIDTFAHSTESSRLLAQPREVFGLKRDGTEFPAEASISKLTVGASNTFTVILRDISARIRTESQLRSLTTQLITVQEQERSRISRELHDDINQRLAMLAIEMDHVAIHPHASSDSSQQAIQGFAKQLAKISDDVRRIAYNFHPSILDDLGLPAAIKHLANEISAQTGIKVIVVQEELDASLTQEIASCLYRIAQESLSNIVKHAQASRVELELTCDDQEITLRVHDNRLGFDLEKVRSNHFGLGLVNMYERVRSARGQLNILTNPESGTNITIQIPLPGAQHDLPAGSLS